MTLLAAYSALLYRYSWQEDILIGTPIANRTRVETEGLIGFFVNTLVLRTRLSGSPTFEELLQGVRETTLAAFTHQDLPFEKLVNALQVKRDTSRHPLFQAFFVFFDSPLQAVELSNLTLIPVDTYNGLSKFDVELAIMEGEEELRLIVLHSVDLFDSATITSFLSDYVRLLEEVVAQPHLRLPDIPLRANTADPDVPVFHNSDLFTFNLPQEQGT
jgi:non-ribosomal peptide synthetase component F